jgi:hypothetical protein
MRNPEVEQKGEFVFCRKVELTSRAQKSLLLRDKSSEILKPQMENTKTTFRFRALRHEI